MAKGLRATWTGTNENGVTDLLQLYHEGYSGSALEFDFANAFDFRHQEITNENDGYLTVHENKIMMGVLNFYPYIDTDQKRTLLDDIADSNPKDFMLTWLQDGVVKWRGYPHGKILTHEEDKDFFATIQFRDFEILKGIDCELSDTRKTIIEIFADLFKKLDMLIPGSPGIYPGLKTHTGWVESNTNENDDFLNQIYADTYPLRDYKRSGDEADKPISVFEALKRLSAPGLLIDQRDGKFIIRQLSAYKDPSNVLECDYDSVGVQTSSSFQDLTEQGYTDSTVGTPSLKTSSINSSYPALKKVGVEYDHRSLQSGIEVPSSVQITGAGTQKYSTPIVASGDEFLLMSASIRARMVNPWKLFYTFSNGDVNTTGDNIAIPSSLSNNSKIRFVNDQGGLPNPLQENITYYVEYIDGNQIGVRDVAGGNVIDLTTQGSGRILVLDTVSIPTFEFALTYGDYFLDYSQSDFILPGDINTGINNQILDSTNLDLVYDKLTFTGHGFKNGQILRFSAIGSSSLPSSLSPGTDYYVINSDTSEFQISTEYEGTAVVLADVGSGSWYAQSVVNIRSLSLGLNNNIFKEYNGSVAFEVPSLPSGVDADLTLHIFQSRLIESQISEGLFDETYFENVAVQVRDASSSSGTSIEYELTQDVDFPTIYNTQNVWFGDGPYRFSRSSFRFSTNTEDVTTAWRVRGDVTYRGFGEALLKELLNHQRTRTKKINSDITGEYDWLKVLDYRSMNLVYAGGSYKGGKWHPVLMEVNWVNASDTFTELVRTDPSGTSGNVIVNPTTDNVSEGDADDTYLAKLENLADLPDVAIAQQNLNLEPGADVQAWDPQLDSLATLTPAQANFLLNIDQDINTGASPVWDGATINGNLYVYGNIYQQGDTYVTHAEEIYSENDFITMRYGAVTGLGVNEISGHKVLQADGTNDVVIGVDNQAVARVGWEGGTLQAIATREDTPVSNGVEFWDATNFRMATSADLIFDGSNLLLGKPISLDYAGSSVSHEIKFRGVSGSSYEVAIRANGEGLEIYEPEDGNKRWLFIGDDVAGETDILLGTNARKVWHEGNDGSGSGLDADLWDGNQFATYINQPLLLTSDVIFNSVTAGAGSLFRAYSSSETDITGLVPGSSAGTIIEGLPNAHVVVGIRGNDVNDGFHIIETSNTTAWSNDDYDSNIFTAKRNGITLFKNTNVLGIVGLNGARIDHTGTALDTVTIGDYAGSEGLLFQLGATNDGGVTFASSSTTIVGRLVYSNSEQELILIGGSDITKGIHVGASSINFESSIKTKNNTSHFYRNTTIGAGTAPSLNDHVVRIEDSGISLYMDGNALYSDTTAEFWFGTQSSFGIYTNNSRRLRVTTSAIELDLNVNINGAGNSRSLNVNGIQGWFIGVTEKGYISPTATGVDFNLEGTLDGVNSGFRVDTRGATSEIAEFDNTSIDFHRLISFRDTTFVADSTVNAGFNLISTSGASSGSFGNSINFIKHNDSTKKKVAITTVQQSTDADDLALVIYTPVNLSSTSGLSEKLRLGTSLDTYQMLLSGSALFSGILNLGDGVTEGVLNIVDDGGETGTIYQAGNNLILQSRSDTTGNGSVKLRRSSGSTDLASFAVNDIEFFYNTSITGTLGVSGTITASNGRINLRDSNNYIDQDGSGNVDIVGNQTLNLGLVTSGSFVPYIEIQETNSQILFNHNVISSSNIQATRFIATYGTEAGAGVEINNGFALSFENNRHWITYNDGAGNFNLRVGNKYKTSAEVFTESGYAFQDEWSQSGGWRQFNVSTVSGAVDDSVTWRTMMVYTADTVSLRYQGTEVFTTASTGVTIPSGYQLNTEKAVFGTYVSGILGTGAIIDSTPTNGSFLEVDNMRIRKEFRTHIFKRDELRASNGFYAITDVSEVAETKTFANTDTSVTLDIKAGVGYSTFNVNDEIEVRNIAEDSSSNDVIEFTVTAIDTTDPTFTRLTVDVRNSNGGTVIEGDTIIRLSGGLIMFDASSQYSPFQDILFNGDAKVRMGNVRGIGALGLSADTWGVYAKDNIFLDFGDSNIFKIGKDVGGSGKHGVYQNANNYWYGDGDFQVYEDGDNYLRLLSGSLSMRAQNVFISDANERVVIDTVTPQIKLENSVGMINLSGDIGANGGDGFEANNSAAIRISADGLGSGQSNYVSMYYADTSNYGIEVYGTGEQIFWAGEESNLVYAKLVGWTARSSIIYSQTASGYADNSYSTSGIGLGSVGWISAPNFYLGTTSSGMFGWTFDALRLKSPNDHLFLGNTLSSVDANNRIIIGNWNQDSDPIIRARGDSINTYIQIRPANNNLFRVQASGASVLNVTKAGVVTFAGWTANDIEFTGTNARLRSSGVLSLGSADGWNTANSIYIDGANSRMSIGSGFKYSAGNLVIDGSATIGGFTTNSTNIRSAFTTNVGTDQGTIWMSNNDTTTGATSTVGFGIYVNDGGLATDDAFKAVRLGKVGNWDSGGFNSFTENRYGIEIVKRGNNRLLYIATKGSGTATEAHISGLEITEDYLEISGFRLGQNVNSTNDGIYAPNGDYWYTSNAFRFGGASGISYSGSGAVTIGSNVNVNGDISGASGTFAGGITATTGSIASYTIAGTSLSTTGVRIAGEETTVWASLSDNTFHIQRYNDGGVAINRYGIKKDDSNYIYNWVNTSDSTWGIMGKNSGSILFQLGSTNKIAGLTIGGDYLSIGNLRFGENVNGSNDGIYINSDNYWYDTGAWRVGGSTNYISASSGGVVDANLSQFYMQSGDLLITSTTGTQATYSPTSITSSIFTNSTFASNISGWTNQGSTLAVHDTGNSGRAKLILENDASSFSYFYETYTGISAYAGDTITFTFSLNKPYGLSTNAWLSGDINLQVRASLTGDSGYYEDEVLTISPSDVNDDSGAESTFSLTVYVKEDWDAIRVGIWAGQHDLSGNSHDNWVYFNGITAVRYTKTQVTLNQNGLNIYRSPKEQIKLDGDGSIFAGGSAYFDELRIKALGDYRSMSTPKLGQVNLGFDQSESRLYLVDAQGNKFYITATPV